MRDLSPSDGLSGDRHHDNEITSHPTPPDGQNPLLDDTAGMAVVEGDDPTAEVDAAADDGRRPRRWRRRKREKRRSLQRTIVEWAAVIGGGIAIALLIQAFLVQAFWIPSASMMPTLNEGDRVLVNKRAYTFGDVRPGHVIVFSRPSSAGDGLGPEEEINDLIKRVIAVEGDVIESRNQQLWVNDEPIDEPYLPAGSPTDNIPRQRVPDSHVYVLGDNRTNSEDSRFFGPVPEEDIVGKAFLQVWPLGDLGRL